MSKNYSQELPPLPLTPVDFMMPRRLSDAQMLAEVINFSISRATAIGVYVVARSAPGSEKSYVVFTQT